MHSITKDRNQIVVELDHADIIITIKPAKKVVAFVLGDTEGTSLVELSFDAFQQFVSALVGMTSPSSAEVTDMLRYEGPWKPTWAQGSLSGFRHEDCTATIDCDSESNISTVKVLTQDEVLTAVLVDIESRREAKPNVDAADPTGIMGENDVFLSRQAEAETEAEEIEALLNRRAADESSFSARIQARKEELKKNVKPT